MMKNELYDLVIIGAGPAGMSAALTLKKKKPDASVLILEKNDVVGKKLAVTGNGRCNIDNATSGFYNENLAFFESIGLSIFTEDEGRAYPTTESAIQTREYLLKQLIECKVELMLQTEVTDVSVCSHCDKDKEELKLRGAFDMDFTCEDSNIFCIKAGKKLQIYSRNLLVATGGKSVSLLGSTGDGFKFAKSVCHKVNPPYPSLTPVKIVDDISSLNKMRIRGKLMLYKDKKLIHEEVGQVQFKQKSISGIVTLNTSMDIRPDGKADLESSYAGYVLVLNPMHHFDIKHIRRCLKAKLSILEDKGLSNGAKPVPVREEDTRIRNIISYLLEGLFPVQFAKYVADNMNLAGEKVSQIACDNVTEFINYIIRQVQNLEFHIAGLEGWKEAQTTGGGVDQSELNSSFQSKNIKGLYFAGEIIDYRAKCGGYNLSFCWHSGIKVGTAIGELI